MNKKEEFKEFVRANPQLIRYVREGDMSWQKFYEVYDLYGKDGAVWGDYIKKEERVAAPEKKTTESVDWMTWLKNIDLNSIENGMNSLQRVVGLLGELATKETPVKTPEYKPRPLYKHFED